MKLISINELVNEEWLFAWSACFSDFPNSLGFLFVGIPKNLI